EYIPSSMNTELYYEQESSFIKGKLNDGKGLLINLSQAQGHDNFLTHWTNDLATHAPDIRDRVDYTFFRDTISNVNKYSFFFNYTCYNNMLNQTNPISRHFMQTQNGGGIGYIGSTTYDFSSTEYPELNESMLDLIFNDSVFEVGKALALSKVAVIPEVITDPWIEWNGRTAMFSFLYLGDPQLKIYTDTPQIITITCPDSLGRGDYQTVHVKATSGGQDLSGAQVCLHMPDNNPEIYKIGTTDDTGTVDFSLNLTQTGNISVVVTKDNYFYTVDSAIVTNLGCCDGNTGNANCSASDAPDISDITRIYDYLYLSHAPLCCFEEADCNGDGTVDISDYVRLIDYLYGSHNPLTQCP
ncbi:MAG: C25 family cysteine peptidase, partial [Candidatus Zixiibacteriota bacterium]